MAIVHKYDEFSRIANLCNNDVYLKAYSLVKTLKINYVSYNEHDNSFLYNISDTNCDVTLWYDNDTLIKAKCSCHEVITDFSTDNPKIECEYLFSVIIYHTFEKDDESLQDNLFLTELQNKIFDRYVVTSNSFLYYNYYKPDSLLLVLLNCMLRLKDYQKAQRTFEIICIKLPHLLNDVRKHLNPEDLQLLITLQCEDKPIRDTVFYNEETIQFILHEHTKLTEKDIMDNYSKITNFDRVKENNPSLFEPKNQSNAFKIFLLLKGANNAINKRS